MGEGLESTECVYNGRLRAHNEKIREEKGKGGLAMVQPSGYFLAVFYFKKILPELQSRYGQEIAVSRPC